MLRITMSKSASGAKKYYSESYYNEGQSKELDYYSEKDQIIGKWGGKAAEKLGLRDGISKSDFAALCDNIRPDNGKTLTGRANSKRTVGYDFTFNASKSISLAHAFGSDEDKRKILNAFQQSVRNTMVEVETGMQARVREKGANNNIETKNLAYGEFVHFTTRPIDGVPDPHLHAHCFVFNATHDEQADKWKAGQFRQIKQDAPYYEAYFHSSLAKELQNIGYEVERTDKGIEIKGLEIATLEKFSRRTQEIEEHAKEKGITDNKSKSEIGSRTRESKRAELDSEQQISNWESRVTKQELEQIKNLKTDYSGSTDNSSIAQKSVQYSLDHHLERKSVASDKEILTTAIKNSLTQCTPEQVKLAFKSKENVIEVKEDLRNMVTTKEALAEEKQLIQNANSFKGKFAPIKENYEFKVDFLNKEQKRAVQFALTSQDGITVIAGKAGTGKTTLMKEVQSGILESGKKIFAFAPSAEASRSVQRKEGFKNANTVASLLQSNNHSKLRGQVIWVDEAGLLSNKDMNNIFEIAQRQKARIILSGDTKQHSSVQRGDALRILQKYAGVSSITVSKIQRQKSFLYRQAVKLFSKMNVEKGFKQLDKIGSINEIEDGLTRIKAVANDYVASAFKGKNPQNVLVVSPTHAEANQVTNAIREELKQEGKLTGKEKEFVVLKDLQFTSAQKQHLANYQIGNVLSFHQNVRGVQAGSKLTIVEINDKHLVAANNRGQKRIVYPDQSDRYNVFETKKLAIAAGDKIRITGNGKTIEKTHLFNGGVYYVSGFDREGNIKLSNGCKLSKEYGHFSSGYVVTSHSSQGKTADKVIISQSSLSGRASSMEQFYVSVSRGRQAVSIYTDDKRHLLENIKQSTQRKSATELVGKGDRLKVAIERNRILAFRNKTGKAIETIKSKIKPPELQRTVRASKGKSR